MADVRLGADAERVFPMVEELCGRLGIAIVGPEQVLAAVLMTLAEHGTAGLPAAGALLDAAVAIHGSSEQPPGNSVLWGSAARDALSATVRAATDAGATVIDGRRFALGIVESGQLHPGFLELAGTTAEALRAALTFHNTD